MTWNDYVRSHKCCSHKLLPAYAGLVGLGPWLGSVPRKLVVRSVLLNNPKGCSRRPQPAFSEGEATDSSYFTASVECLLTLERVPGRRNSTSVDDEWREPHALIFKSGTHTQTIQWVIHMLSHKWNSCQLTTQHKCRWRMERTRPVMAQ